MERKLAESYSRSVSLHDNNPSRSILLSLESAHFRLLLGTKIVSITEASMHRRIAILFIASTLIVIVHSDVLKCYMCHSLSNEDCEADMVDKSLQPVECTKMQEWQNSLTQHSVLYKIADLFAVDNPLQHHYPHMACVKLTVYVNNTNVTVRTCQTAKTEIFDPCNAMEKKLKGDMLGTMKQCALCVEDACNGTTFVSSNVFYILLSTLFHVALYHRA